MAVAATSPASAAGGGFAYVANQGGTVSEYTIDATTGALTSVGAVPAGSGATSVAVDVTASFAYVANFFDNNVSAYTIDPATGALTQITGSPFSAGTGPFSVAIDPTGQFVYVANRLANDVSAYVGAIKSEETPKPRIQPAPRP